jgi:glyoxylase-like metal-dependent hydrolase (beta-lactamase superfamily II)
VRLCPQKLVGAYLAPLEHGQVLPLGEAGSMEVLHTPGHSSGSVCYHAKPSAEGAWEPRVMVGDTIFPGSCGRLDLPESNVDDMFESMELLRRLDDSLPVFPGHAYSGASTTIGREKATGLLRPFTRQQWTQMHRRDC